MFQSVFRMSPNQLSLFLPHHNADGFAHFGSQLRFHGIRHIVIPKMRIKTAAGIVPVDFLRKHRKRPEIYSIAVFQNIKTVIGSRNAKNIGNAGGISGICPHPIHIMVPPLNIHIVKAHQFFHNTVRMRPSVEYVSDNMQTVYTEILNQFAKSDDKFSPPIDVQYSL